MKITPITKDQWVSVVKNAVVAGVSTFVVALQASGDVSRTAFYSAAVAAVAAAIKVVEKSFTDA